MNDTLPEKSNLDCQPRIHRRLFAYWSLGCITVLMIAALGGYVRESAMQMLESLAWIFATIVAVYMGGSATESMTRVRK